MSAASRLLRVVPRGERLVVGNPAQTLAGVGAQRMLGDDDIDQRGCICEGLAQRGHEASGIGYALRVKVERAAAASEGRTTTFEVTVPSSMEEIERLAIEATLDYTAGDKSHAARALGIGRKTLYRKLEQYNGGSSDGTEGP